MAVLKDPAICLNMIVRDEAQVVCEVLNSVASYISSWVIIDTGSQDGTQDLIRGHMADLGIPGELHERPWRDFGHNRTEALTLAQGRGDYIWMIDADDIVIGTPPFTYLSADIYALRCKDLNGDSYWQPWLFRDGVPVRWVGVTHEYARWDDDSYAAERLQGEYYIDIRNIGARNSAGQKLPNDRDLLLAEIERDPEDSRSIFYLAATYYGMADFANARTWYARRVEMGGWDQEVYFSMWRIAEAMAFQGEPWPQVQDAYLRAWEFRPTRAEPLYAIARRYREDHRYWLGYLFARRATELPFPERETVAVNADVYTWRALDEQAVCASWINKQADAFTLCRRLLALPELPDVERQRITGNRDVCVPTMIHATSQYSEALVSPLINTHQADVTISMIAGPDLESTERSLISFLHCCTDLSRGTRFLVLDAGLSTRDHAVLQERYRFLEFLEAVPDGLSQLRAHVHTRFWLHLGQGWQFFAPDEFVTRLIAVLEAEPDVFQAGINYADATKLTGVCATGGDVRRTPEAGRYVLTDSPAYGPAMFDTIRLDRTDVLDSLSQSRRTATLDEVLCILDN